MGMDHHCPWMNNCIGIKNQKAFLLFNYYTSVTGMYAVVRALIELIFCYRNPDECLTLHAPWVKALVIVAMFLCCLFVCFTSCMLID